MHAPHPGDLAWTAHPAARQPQQVALLAAVCLFAAYAVLVAFSSFFLCVLAVAILLAATTSFWLPTHYRISAEGIHERRLGLGRMRAWPQLRRVTIGPGAALVSPFAKAHPLERVRGMLIYFDGGPREEIVARLRSHVAMPSHPR